MNETRIDDLQKENKILVQQIKETKGIIQSNAD
jgi:hypothetical protein